MNVENIQTGAAASPPLMNGRGLTYDELLQFFSGLADRMEIVASYEGRIARFEAPRFNVFDYIEPDENKITGILADLLRPNGSHGQGDAFLRSFLRMIGFDAPLPNDIASPVEVRTQDRTRWNRWIDLTVRLGSYIIALENKIDAPEQPKQIGDYMESLESEAEGSWVLIFLTPNGRDPKECDTDEWKKARETKKALSLSYSDLSRWLRSCLTSASSDRVRAFIYDMANWTENRRGRNMAGDLREQIILDFIRKDNGRPYLKTLLAVQDTRDAVRQDLISDFAKALEQELRKQFPPSEWEFDPMIGKSELGAGWPGIFIRRRSWSEQPWSNCWIGLEAKSWQSGFKYGISWKDASRDCPEELQSVLSRLPKRKSNNLWPWYDDVPSFDGVEVKNWSQSETIGLMMGNERGLMDHFLKLFKVLCGTVIEVLEPDSTAPRR